MAAVKGGNMAGPGDDESRPESAAGVSKAAEPEPTAETQPSVTESDEQTRTEIEYADPVDPWAAAEAASIAAGGRPSYQAAPANPGQTWTAPDTTAAEETLKSRKRLLIGGVAGIVVAVVATATVLLWPDHPALDFHRTAEITRFAPEVPFTSSFADTEVLGDRAYFAGVDTDGTLRVLAADTDADGKPLWESTAAGKSASWTTMRATRSALLLRSGLESDTSTSRVVALNVEDGSMLWQQRLGAGDEVYHGADTVLWTDRERNRIVGLGLADGREKWAEVDEDATTVLPMSAPDDLAGPADTTGRAFAPAGTDRFVQFDSDGTVTVREFESGKAVQSRANVSSGGKATVHDGRLYVLETGTPERIFQYDLTNLATEPKALHTAGTSEGIDALTPCGEQLCFVRTTGYDRATSEIVAVGDTAGWRLSAPKTESLVPVGENGLLAIGAEGSSLIVDGTVVWTLADGVAARLDAGNVLRFSEDLSSSVGNRTLSGYHLGDEASAIVEMGEIRDVRSDSCSWNTAVIACVAEKDVVIHSFAG